MAIISAYAGSFPWKKPGGKQGQKADRYAGYQYTVGVGKDKKGREYTSGGFTVVQPNQYTKNPKKPEMVELRLFNGRRSYVPVGDVEQFIGFHALDPSRVTEEMAKEVDAAWEKETGRGRFYTSGGAGHISDMRYNPTMQIMEVTFSNNGASVTFFRIPSGMWSEFAVLAERGTTAPGFDGKPRHLLGIRFWDLVRIRGQREGGRYPYTYTTSGITAGSGAGEYAEMQERQNSPQAQQPVDAAREAMVTNKEEPSPKEKQDEDLEGLKTALGKGFLPVQRRRINNARDVLMDKYGDKSPAYREFFAAVERGPAGWGALLNVIKLYNLKGGNPAGDDYEE
jgi:hypothetical protein